MQPRDGLSFKPTAWSPSRLRQVSAMRNASRRSTALCSSSDHVCGVEGEEDPGTVDRLAQNLRGIHHRCCTKSPLKPILGRSVNWPDTLVPPKRGEGKAHTCYIAWLRQLRENQRQGHEKSRPDIGRHGVRRLSHFRTNP